FMACAATFAITIVMLAVTVQKGLIVIFLMAIALGMGELGGRRILAAGVLLACGAFVTLFQRFVANPDWSFRGSGILLVFRVSASYPFYVGLYPEAIPFSGLDALRLWDGGAGSSSGPSNVEVFREMYELEWVQGAAAAPSHVHAYAEAGVGYSVV